MTVWGILVGLFVLGLMVLAHEWGHFVVARLLRVRVDIFSIGFGPRLFGWRRGPTDYRVSAVPLGGYVKMAGDDLGQGRAGAPDEFLSKPRWQRALIILAGPTMNILLAIVLLAGLYTVAGYQRAAYLDQPPRLAGVEPDTPAARAGLGAGDLVVELDGRPTPTWEDVRLATLLGGKEPLAVTIERGTERFTLVLQPELRGRRQVGFVGWVPYNPLVVTEVEPGMPAAQAGLEVGDEIVAVEGESTSVLGAEGFVERIQASAGASLPLTIRRGGESLEVEVRAEERAWRGETRYFLGIGIGPRLVSQKLGPVAALKQSLAGNWRFAGVLLEVLQRLFTGRASLRQLEGPIGITILSGRAAQLGLASLISLMALISINLGALNLLPIPILDGGHLFVLAIEGARRRDLSLRFKELVTQVSFVLLMLLFAFVMFNDIRRYFFH
ncbi:MAG: RIP metalloprotease RseP [Terriglobia bacterium]